MALKLDIPGKCLRCCEKILNAATAELSSRREKIRHAAYMRLKAAGLDFFALLNIPLSLLIKHENM